MDYELISSDQKKINKYEFRFKGGAWADIFLENWGPGRGKVIISSDWGSWESSWGAMGGTIEEFLLRINNGYLMMNLYRGRPDYFDEDATKELLKKAIIATRIRDFKRKEKYLQNDYDAYHWPDWDKEEARQAWEEIDMLFGYDFRSEEAYQHAFVRECPTLLELWNDPPCPPAVTGYPPRFEIFIEHIWPHVKKKMREELKNGKL